MKVASILQDTLVLCVPQTVPKLSSAYCNSSKKSVEDPGLALDMENRTLYLYSPQMLARDKTAG